MLPNEYLDGLIEVSNRNAPAATYLTDQPPGCIYVGGGKYWPMIVAGINMLRDTGSSMPIEVWHRGTCETVYPEDVAGLGVTFHDVDRMGIELNDSRVPVGTPAKGGWEAKLYAFTHTRMSKVLYLDADAYVVANPDQLLAESGDFTFWRDLPSQVNSIKWEYVLPGGCKCGVPQIQGGQLVVDRIKMRRTIEAAHYMCQHSDFYFKKMYGDQDTWRVALSLTREPYTNLGKANWTAGIAFVCNWQDAPLVVHRCRGKLFTPEFIPKGNTKYTNPNYALPKEVQLFDHFAKAVNSHLQFSKDAFTNIYAKKLWGFAAASGSGSTLREAQLYIDLVNKFIRKNNLATVVDVGCGDGLVGSKIECQSYTGIDCCEDVIRSNQRKYKGKYLTLDILAEYDRIPVGDILLCKDVLHHLPTSEVQRFVDYLLESKRWNFIALCQDYAQIHERQDCHIGGYRALSFDMLPLKKYPLIQREKVHHKELGILRGKG